MDIALVEAVDKLNPHTADNREAILYGLFSTDHTTLTENDIVRITSHRDVYDLLDSDIAKFTAQNTQAIIVETCGWAAPTDSDFDGAPSEHPDRRRVRLLVIASPDGVASALRFSDDWENPIFDAGQAKGSLADAVQSLFAD